MAIDQSGVAQSGSDASRPAANAGVVLYYANDTFILYQSNGSAWSAVTSSGTTQFYNDTTANVLATVPTANSFAQTTDGAIQYSWKQSEAIWRPVTAGRDGTLTPLASTFNQVNASGGAAAPLADYLTGVAGSGLVLNCTTNGQCSYRASVTLGATFTVEAPFAPTAYAGAGLFYGLCLVATSGTTDGKFLMFLRDHGATPQVYAFYGPSIGVSGGFTALIGSAVTIAASNPQAWPLWLKISRGASNTVFAMGNPETSYVTYASIANATIDTDLGGAPTHGGLAGGGGAANASRVLVPSFYSGA